MAEEQAQTETPKAEAPVVRPPVVRAPRPTENTAPGQAASKDDAKKERGGFKDPRPAISVFRCPRGESVKFLVERGSDLGLQNELKRLDVFAEFSTNTCRTRDPVVIDFLVAHSDVSDDEHSKYHAERADYFESQERYDMYQAHLNCLDSCAERKAFRNSEDPMCEAWMDIETRKAEKVNAYASLPADFTLDSLLEGRPGSTQNVRKAGRRGG